MTRSSVVFCLLAISSALSPSPAVAADAKLVLRNARLFTMAEGQREPFLGYLAVAQDGTLLAVGHGDLPANLHAESVLDAQGSWVIPGFISAHSHLWQAAYRGLAADKTLSGWIDDLYGQKASKASADDLYWFCLLGALDHVEHGVTTAFDFTYGADPARNAANAFDKSQYRAEAQSGLRFVHAYQAEKIAPGVKVDAVRSRLKTFLDWTAAQPPSSRFLGVMLSGSTAFKNTYQQAVVEAALMKEFHLANQSHYLEPPETQGEERTKFRWFMESGLLSKQLIFGHFIHTDDFILQQTAEAGASMSWNPMSNGRLASGVADIPKYLKLGIRVGMGVDGEASADLADPFENMRTGLFAIRDKYEDAGIMSPYQVLWLHTMGSAGVLGVSSKLGSLEPGKFADFLVVDPARLGAVLEDPYANLVLAASERDIERVYVGGELLVENNRLLHADLKEVEAESSRRALATR